MATTAAVRARAQAARKLRFLPKPENSSVYANNARLRISLFDVALDFGEVVEVGDKEIVVQPKATVVMSPQHAKALLNVLNHHIQQYEKQFGEIRCQAEAQATENR